MAFVGQVDQQNASLTFGTAVRAAREGKGWTQEQLAKRIGVTQGRISQIESGNINADNIIFNLCKLLDTPPPAEMFSDVGEFEWFQAGRKIRSLDPELFAQQLKLAKVTAATSERIRKKMSEP